MASAQSRSPDAQIKSLHHELRELRTQLQAIQKQLAELKNQNKQQTERLEAEGKTEKMQRWLKARSRVRSERNALTQQKLLVKRTEEGLKRTVATESKKMEARQAAADKAAQAAKQASVHAEPKKVSHRQRNR
ncbi:MAG: hypothetical protein R3236_08325, partial [Phycisphaeraceae bacterium]|nr:hypothetical protein [Phycisphaeraceae bacterium]